MNMVKEPIGLYIHVPFCIGKCPYCNFYSLPIGQGEEGEEKLDTYTQAVCISLQTWGGQLDRPADTLYFGGGTPSLLGGRRLAHVIETARRYFGLQGAEITLEANPGSSHDLGDTFRQFAAAGGSRLSMGMQTADAGELHFLGRRHTPSQVEEAVRAAKKAGIGNISLDMMIGLERQAAASLRHSAAVCQALEVQHVSAYLLKIEEGTPFYRRRQGMHLPDEDETAALYLCACEELERLGFRQYEISNFAQHGFESRHNLKYWQGSPYLGIGPAAHSYLDGKRFYYPQDMAAFVQGCSPLAESGDDEAIPDGSPAEYMMLRLRLREGLTAEDYALRFGTAVPAIWYQRARKLPSHLITADETGIRLTRQGFLLSNAVISRLLDI